MNELRRITYRAPIFTPIGCWIVSLELDRSIQQLSNAIGTDLTAHIYLVWESAGQVTFLG